jgi:hypothetical protein
MATKNTNVIELPELKKQSVQIRLVGDSPLIMHRFGEKARKQMLDKQMGKAKSGREAKDPEADYQESMYRTDDGAPGFPAIAFKAAAVSAANDAGIQKVLARRAFHVAGEIIPIDGEPIMREDVVRIGMGTADIRHRAEFKHWTVTLDVVFNAGIISLEQLINLFQIAGFGVGVGEWRPERDGTFGTFHVAGENE